MSSLAASVSGRAPVPGSGRLTLNGPTFSHLIVGCIDKAATKLILPT